MNPNPSRQHAIVPEQTRSDTVSFKTWVGVLGAILGAFMAVLDI